MPGVGPMFIGGIGIYKAGNDDIEPAFEGESKVGFTAGLGPPAGFTPELSANLRRLNDRLGPSHCDCHSQRIVTIATLTI
jgi:hypothetical protein